MNPTLPVVTVAATVAALATLPPVAALVVFLAGIGLSLITEYEASK